jgi:hypothetical protein
MVFYFLFEFDQNSCKSYSLLNYSSKLSNFLFHLQLSISSEVRVQMHVLLQTLNWPRDELQDMTLLPCLRTKECDHCKTMTQQKGLKH